MAIKPLNKTVQLTELENVTLNDLKNGKFNVSGVHFHIDQISGTFHHHLNKGTLSFNGPITKTTIVGTMDDLFSDMRPIITELVVNSYIDYLNGPDEL